MSISTDDDRTHADVRPNDDEFRYVSANDPLTAILLDDLAREYDERYGLAWGEPASVEISRYPAEQFAAPRGAFVLLLRDGQAIAGGAFKRYDERTAELKRIWTHSDHRGRGHARAVVAELEAEAVRRGYERIFLTTGPRQPEAQRLYIVTGYTPLYDTALPADEVGIHGYVKHATGGALEVDDLLAYLAAHRAPRLDSAPHVEVAAQPVGHDADAIDEKR